MKLSYLVVLGALSCFTQTALAADDDRCGDGYVPAGPKHPNGCIKEIADPCPGHFFSNKLRKCVKCASGTKWTGSRCK